MNIRVARQSIARRSKWEGKQGVAVIVVRILRELLLCKCSKIHCSAVDASFVTVYGQCNAVNCVTDSGY